jgi:hypothetical protein
MGRATNYAKVNELAFVLEAPVRGGLFVEPNANQAKPRRGGLFIESNANQAKPRRGGLFVEPNSEPGKAP